MKLCSLMKYFLIIYVQVTLENDVNIPCPSSRLGMSATGVTPLPIWNIPPGHTDPVTKDQINQASVQYLCLCHRGEDDLTPPSCYQQWSIPLRIASNDGGTRLNISVPFPCTEDEDFGYLKIFNVHYGPCQFSFNDKIDFTNVFNPKT